jgi:hypothetical protein
MKEDMPVPEWVPQWMALMEMAGVPMKIDLLRSEHRGRRWIDRYGNHWWWNEVWASFNDECQMVDCSPHEPAGHFRGPFTEASTTVDPLTVESWHNLQPFRWGCDCGAPAEALHSPTCAVTPIYASLVPPEMNMIIGSFHAANATVVQTVIKCAECGRELLGRDADVIYRAPGSTTDNPDGRTWYRPHPQYIVKAVCPRHNRKGRIGYQRPMPTGYEWH